MNLIVLLHGYGSCSEDISNDFKYIIDNYNSGEIIALNAPSRCDLFPEKRQWFKLSYLNSYLFEEIKKQAEYIIENVKTFISNRSFPKKIIFIGHSQGAMLASFIAVNNLIKNCISINVSASLPYVDYIKPISHSNLFFVHGKNDQMIPLVELRKQIANLNKGKVVLTNNLFIVEESGHILDNKLIAVVLKVLNNLIR